jgi:uncharacterized circularly permuted ATP-grasp superfamily protein/uncharacterized alpha-E superfamily protein
VISEPHVEASATSGEAPSADPLPGYAALPNRFDELRAADGGIRPAWRELLRLLGPDPTATLGRAQAACGAAIADLEVSMNVYAGDRSGTRPWPLDTVPLLVAADDWQKLQAGVVQRVRLLNELLRDIYGPQRLLKRGLLPAALVSANPHFLHPCVGLGNSSRVMAHTCAVDVARSPDGHWWVLRDRIDAPSGLGYSLQNRILTRQAMSRIFHRAPVERLYDYFSAFRASLGELAPSGGEADPRVAFLTSGAANETYYEQAYLARHLGYPLVEGSDLTTRDGQVFLRTVGGLKRIETLVRRVDSAYCDPLELLSSSLLGVPGLVHAAHQGRIALANQLGAGALETTALLAFLGPLAREVLGEELVLPSVATWWCGQEPARDYVLEHLDELVIKPAYREANAPGPRHGPTLDATQREQLAAQIRANPYSFCGQELVHLGTTPAWIEGTLQPAPFVLRLFVTWSDGEYRVMPGGLTRYQPAGGEALVTLRHGGVTKDTWVLRSDGVDPTPLPPATALADLLTRAAETPSRLADNLFWLGRYLERTGQLAHLLGKLEPEARAEINSIEPDVAQATLQLALQLQGHFAPGPLTSDPDPLLAAAANAELPTSLLANLHHLVRNIDQVKARLPSGAWRCLRHLRQLAHPDRIQPDALSATVAALETIVNESLARDTAWRFLMIGRHLERALHLVYFVEKLVLDREGKSGPSQATEFRLQTLLHLTESLFSYRSLHHGVFQPEPVLGWLLSANENPRGLRHLAGEIRGCLHDLPDRLAPQAVQRLREESASLERRMQTVDATRLVGNRAATETFLRESRLALWELSDHITRIYFSHAEAAAEEA